MPRPRRTRSLLAVAGARHTRTHPDTAARVAAAEPRPAELPLPGGRRGATVRLHPLLCGRSVAPPAYLLRESGRLAGLDQRDLALAHDLVAGRHACAPSSTK